MTQTTILCKYCIELGIERRLAWIPETQYYTHIEEKHSNHIEDKVIAAIDSAKDKVHWVLETFPEARSNEGLLAEKVLQYWPFKSARCIYTPSTGALELKADNFSDFIHAMKHIGTLTRLSRAIRHAEPELRGSPQKEIEREIEYAESVHHWGIHKEG